MSVPAVGLRLQLENDLVCELCPLCTWKCGYFMRRTPLLVWEMLVRQGSHLGPGMCWTSQVLVETTAWRCMKRYLRGQGLPETQEKLKFKPWGLQINTSSTHLGLPGLSPGIWGLDSISSLLQYFCCNSNYYVQELSSARVLAYYIILKSLEMPWYQMTLVQHSIQ